jgi:hypothetical protein
MSKASDRVEESPSPGSTWGRLTREVPMTIPKVAGAPPPTPVRYEPSMETINEHEAKTIQDLINTTERIQAIVAEDFGRAKRGVHAKAHGLLVGELEILPGLPRALSHGLFALPRTYPTILRLSTIPGDLLDDAVSVPRAASLKIMGVSGVRVPGSEQDVTQDFLFLNGRAFPAPTPEAFLRTLMLLAVTTDRAPRSKRLLSSLVGALEKILESIGRQSATLLTLGGYPKVNILGDEFYTQGPVLYGNYIAKLALKPLSDNLRALAKQPLNLSGHPDGIREAVVEFFRANSAVWDMQVQLCTNIKTMPIEDASVIWPETESPFLSVARLRVPAQDAWRADRVTLIDERMSFSPWHALAAHRPLGGIMRVRQAVYAAAAQFRVEYNNQTLVEPRDMADILESDSSQKKASLVN